MWAIPSSTLPHTLEDFDVSGDPGRIDVPTLTICGEYDEAMPAACRDFRPNYRMRVDIWDASHTRHLEQRDAFLAKLRTFLASVE